MHCEGVRIDQNLIVSEHDNYALVLTVASTSCTGVGYDASLSCLTITIPAAAAMYTITTAKLPFHTRTPSRASF